MEKLISALIITLIAVSSHAATIYVDANGTGDYPTIQAAINGSNNGDEIVLLPGTYTGDGNRDINFLGKAITVRGTDPNDRSVVEATVIDCNGTDQDNHRGFYFVNDEGRNSVLEGLTITNGYTELWGGGGAIYIGGGSPTISKCIVTNNHVDLFDLPGFCYGGGIKIVDTGSNPLVTHCIINNNSVGPLGHGGGISCGYGSDVIIQNCQITNNTASGDGFGGGIYIDGNNVAITNCTITDNSTTEAGGGICLMYNDSITITNSIIWGNSPNQIDTYYSAPIVTYSDIQGGWPGTGNINSEPCFAAGPLGDYYLSQAASGQDVNSPCVDTGSDTAANLAMNHLITRTDEMYDKGIVDMGYHYPDSSSRIIYVDANGTGDYPTIRAAINAASDGDTIILQPGTYTGDGNRDIDFLGKAITVRSQTGPENCIIDVNAGWLDGHRGFHFHSGEGLYSLLEGLTIKNGLAWNENGGGILCQNSSPTINDCIITNNSAEMHMTGGGSGGGICCEQSYCSITNCTVINNTCSFSGGGILIVSGGPTVSDCNISSNKANVGAGIACQADNATIIKCTINSNEIDMQGAGISCDQGSNASILNCSIVGNFGLQESTGGGGIACTQSSPAISNCLIAEGSVRYGGGGVYCSDNSEPKIYNCTIVDNHTNGRGGGIYCYLSDPNITNSILWANTAGSGGPQIALRQSSFPSTLSVSYCSVQGGPTEAYVEQNCSLEWLIGNIDDEPCLVDADSDDYHLQSQAGRWDPDTETWVVDSTTSPCIDAGNPGCSPGDEPAPNGNRINMGAYGGTVQASKSPAGFRSLSDLNNDWSVDFNDLSIFVDYWLQSGTCLPADLDRDSAVDLEDYAVFTYDPCSGGAVGEPEIVYQIEGCNEELMLNSDSNDLRFTVTVQGRYILFEDMMLANCCPEELVLQMSVEDNLITIQEIEYLGEYACLCLCDHPVTATLGPFSSGTYTLEVYQEDFYGGFIGATTITID